MIIIANDPNTTFKRKPVIVRKMFPSSRVCKELGICHIWRTNGVTTEHLRLGLNVKDHGEYYGVLNRFPLEKASESDKAFYNTAVVGEKRNDKLIKACNDVYNRLLKCGYLSKIFGVRGWVKEIDSSNVRIFLNTDASSRVISALLKAWYPQYDFKVGG